MAYKLHVISSSLVQMATDNSTSSMPRTELTPWDLQFLPYGSIQKGILFHKPPKGIIDHLKNTFSRTLDFFPPLAGRLGATNHADGTASYFVDCNNAGAEYTHAAVTGEALSAVDLSEAKYVPEIVSEFFTLKSVRNIEGFSKPLLGVQVTELVDGLFIGITANHAVVDGASFWHFIHSWSEISRGLGKISKNPEFERDFLKGNVGIPILPLHDRNDSRNPTPARLLTRVFHFSRDRVSKLKAKANAEAESNKISSLQAILAHLWICVARARSKGYNRETHLPLPIGTRARIPLPDGYFGNAIFVPSVGSNETELIKKGLGYTGLKINAFVAQQTSDSAVIGFIEKWLNDYTLTWVADIWITSTPRHNVYSNDFGWGKPVAVRSGQWDDEQMTLFPASESGGIDIEVCLLSETLLELEGDTEFLEAITTLK